MTTSNTRPPAPCSGSRMEVVTSGPYVDCPECKASVYVAPYDHVDGTPRQMLQDHARPADTGEPRDNLFASAKDAQAEVASWPKWKQEAAARARVTVPQDERAVACNVHVDSDVYCRFGTQGCDVHEPPGGVVSVGGRSEPPPGYSVWDFYENCEFGDGPDFMWTADGSNMERPEAGQTCAQATAAAWAHHDTILNRGRATGNAETLAGVVLALDEYLANIANVEAVSRTEILRGLRWRIANDVMIPGHDAISKAIAAARREAEQERDLANQSARGWEQNAKLNVRQRDQAYQELAEARAATAALEQRLAELAAECNALKLDGLEWRRARNEAEAERDAAVAMLAQCEPVVAAVSKHAGIPNRGATPQRAKELSTLLTNIRRALGTENT